ncbi:MAG TPA: hypothetical protein VGY50_01355 [Streptosporangiaceae bacterium]|nr:hypothetical protein [Streptosporangiaceae bacterium]
MNPMLNYWAVVERMQSLRAEADATARYAAARHAAARHAAARHAAAGHAAAGHAAARARQPRRSRRGLALVAGLGRGRPGAARGRPGTARGIVIKAGEAL